MATAAIGGLVSLVAGTREPVVAVGIMLPRGRSTP